MSPPTPAPSPVPKERWSYKDLGDGDLGDEEVAESELAEEILAGDLGRKGEGTGDDVGEGSSRGRQGKIITGE
jgi:hypothetical protein